MDKGIFTRLTCRLIQGQSLVALLTSLNIVTHSNLSITMDLARFLTLPPTPEAHGDIPIESGQFTDFVASSRPDRAYSQTVCDILEDLWPKLRLDTGLAGGAHDYQSW
jgi:hypothetical protein